MAAMATQMRTRLGDAWGLVAHSLSGRLLLLTIYYVMITQVLIFVPSVGRYHRNLLSARVDGAEIAILPFTEPRNGLSDMLRAQLLTRAGAIAVMLPRADQREIFLSNEIPSKIDVRLDLRNTNPFVDMINGMDCLLNGGSRILQITAPTRIRDAQDVEAIVSERPIHSQLKSYAWGIALLAVLISLATGILVFISLYLVLVRPMRHITRTMVNFRANPEDASRIVTPSSRLDEIGIAERELSSMQRDIYNSLQQRARLAANTLRYGRADEHPPQRRMVRLKPIVEEAREAALAGKHNVQLVDEVEDDLEIDADTAQLFRVMLNVLRNAGEVLSEKGGTIHVSAARNDAMTQIDIQDNGPGIPPNVRERLFQPFAGSARPGGSGLGLAIARDLARAHGGDVTLVATGDAGTRFRIEIPDRQA